MHGVIFDIDGTLLQSVSIDNELYWKSVEAVVGRVRRKSIEEYEFVTDTGILLQVLRDNAIPAGSDPAPRIKDRFMASLTQHIRDNGPFAEIPGARDLLKRLLLSDKHAVAIATGCWRRSALLKLETSGFDLTEIPVASADDSHDRATIMRIALSSLGSGFESITYYGDGPWDRDACQALGWRFVPVGPELQGLTSFFSESVA